METTGNFLTQPNKDFPLDCETLDMLQSNAALTAAIGGLLGDKLILSGCGPTANGTRRDEGYVFVKTRAYPRGEVMRWEGGDTTGGMYVKLEAVGVNAMGVAYPQAYTRRTLAPGVGEENFNWADFKIPATPAELEAKIAELAKKLSAAESKAEAEPLGVVKMWAGSKVPDGYALCDGSELKQSEYPGLFSAIGTTFNNARNYNGSTPTTQPGFFRLPDLRGRFVVGYSDVDNDYKEYGNAGGEKVHALTAEEMPEHAHRFKDYYFASGAREGAPNVDRIGTNGFLGTEATAHTSDCLYFYKHSTESAGAASTHENRPPYYVLAYIMKLK